MTQTINPPQTPYTPQWVAVQKSTHQHTHWVKYTHYQFTKNTTAAPILQAELAELLPFYPLAFLATEQSFQLVALQSLQPNLNLYVNAQGQWRVPYTPATFRSHPFALVEKTAEELMLCIDQNSEFVHLNPEANPAGEPLFTPENQLTQPVTEIVNFLQQYQANKKLTQQAVDLLAQHQLIVSWPLEQNQNNTPTPVKGVYQIDANALKQLNGAALAELNQHHALEIAHAQLHSKPRLKHLETLNQHHQKEQQTTDKAQNLNLDQIFGEEDNNLLKF